ncbi:hypothetical protein DM860_005041 [Cuscuta australis]|uniref:Uncharacterized protein n=1 Tax=Cuscuta australis TaxID=267555 RepID=A0A328DM84_9ASTE|nr:hypothetical protein DM860_005041 [Cuscuta australis]
MAYLLWNLHIRPSCHDLHYWASRESYLSSNQSHNFALFHGGIASEFSGHVNCCFGRVGRSCRCISSEQTGRHPQRAVKRQADFMCSIIELNSLIKWLRFLKLQ